MTAPASRHANRTWHRDIAKIDAELRHRRVERDRLAAEGDTTMAEVQTLAIDELLDERFEANR